MTGRECTCDWPPGNPLAVHRSWCPARPSGLLDDQADPAMRAKLQRISDGLRKRYTPQAGPPQDRPADPPVSAGPAAVTGPPRAAAEPGAPPGSRDGRGAPGASPPLLGQQAGGGEAPASRPGRRQQDAAPGTGITAWREAIAAHNRAKRQQRGKRPGPEITGVRIPPPGGAA